MLIAGLLFGLLALAPLLALVLLAVASSERARALPRRIARRLRAPAPSIPDSAQAATIPVASRPDDAAGPHQDQEPAASRHAAD